MTAASSGRPVVVGGGLAGSMAALHLAERGLRPVLLEAHPERLGGRWRGDPTGGPTLVGADGQAWTFPAEHGIHGLWGQYHNLRASLLRALGPDMLASLVRADHQDWVYAGHPTRPARRAELGHVVSHTLLPAPFHYLALFSRPGFLGLMTPLEVVALPWVFASLQLALAYDPLVRPEDAAVVAYLPLRRFFLGWPPRLRALVSALGRSGLFADPDRAPLGGFLAFLRFYTLLRRDAQRFHYLPADPQTAVFGPLRARLEQLGVEVRMGATASHIQRSDEGAWQVAWQDVLTAQPHQTEPGPLILALDAPAARALLLASDATRGVAEAHLDWPPGLASAVARTWWADEPVPPSHHYAEAAIFGGVFTGDNLFWLHRIQRGGPYAAWAAAAGGSVAEVHVYGPDAVLDLPDAALLALVTQDLKRAYPRLRATPLLASSLQRNPPTHTLLGAGSTNRHLEVESPWPGLWFCGDWVRYPSPSLFLERATITGIAAANGVLRARGLPPWPIIPASPPEPLAAILGHLWRRLRVA